MSEMKNWAFTACTVLVDVDAVFVTCFPMFRSSIEGQSLERRGCTGVLISV